MIHVRAVSPPDRTDQVVELLAGAPYVMNLIVQRGAAYHPDGDAFACDVLAGAANDVLRGLRRLEIDVHGSIVIEPVDMAFPGRASETAVRRLGALVNTPVWAQVEARIRSGGGTRRASTSTWSSRVSSARSASSPTPRS